MAYHGEVQIIQGTQNIAGNYTSVTANFYCVRDSGYAYSGYTTYPVCTLDGTTETKTLSSFDISASNPKILLGSITKNVYHNSDGSKTVSASFSWDSKNSYVGTITGSATLKLTTIPRKSSVSCNSFNIGDATTIVISRASSSFTHTVTWTFGGASGTIATKTSATTIGTTIPASSLYAQIPKAKSGTGTITCQTYSGNTLIGTSTCTFTAYAKENDCIPSVSTTIVDINDVTIALTGSNTKFIKGFSRAKVTANATAKNSATISKYNISTSDGKTSTTANTTFNNIAGNKITVKVTDSRGYSKTVTYTLDWINYIALAFTSIKVERPESTADKANMVLKGNYYNGSFGNTANGLSLQYRYKEENGTYSEWTTLTPTLSGNTFSYTEVLENLNHEKEYIFEFMIDDQLMTVYDSMILTKGIPIMRVGKDYVDVEGILYENGVQVETKETASVANYAGGNIDPNTTLYNLILTKHTNNPSSNGEFYYIRTIFYAGKTVESNRCQMAYGYRTNKVWFRYFYNGTWSAWERVDRETERTMLSSTSVTSVTNGSWQDMLTTAISANLSGGKYFCVLSFAISSTENGMATVRPITDGNESTNAHRCSIPVGNGLVSSGQVSFYISVAEGIHTIQPQIFSNVNLNTVSVFIEFYKIGEA